MGGVGGARCSMKQGDLDEVQRGRVVCMCEGEREREREWCVCVRGRERERERERVGL